MESIQDIITGLSLLAGAFGLFGWRKNRKIVEAVIAGVETAAEVLDEEDKGPRGDRVKSSIRVEAEKRGVQKPLHKAVKKHTKK